MKNYGNKGVFSKKSLKESKKFHYGEEIIKFLEKYGYNKRGEDFEQNKDYSTVTYMYAIPHGMRPQTPYVEFTVDADNDAFIFGEFFTDGRKGYSTEFDSVEDLEYFVSNANYSNVDLTEKKSATKSIKEKKFNPNDYFYELWELNGKRYKDWTVFEWKDIEDDFFNAYAKWGKTFFNMYSGNGDSNLLVNNGKLMSVLDKNRVAITGKDLNDIAYELNELIRNYKNTESKKSVRKSIKEGKDSAFYDGIAKEFHFSKDEKIRYKDKTYISAIAVLFDRINNAIKTYGRNSDEEYNALNDCWEVITSAKQNGFNVDYDEDRWNKIAGLPNYH